MKINAPLALFLLLFISVYTLHGQAPTGGWGNCEFATVTSMNAFDPSGSSYTCKKAYVTATDEHYRWDGSAWVLESDDDQNIYNTSDALTGDRLVDLDGYDLNFDANTLAIDGAIDHVGVGTANPTSAKLHINATGGSSGLHLDINQSDRGAYTIRRTNNNHQIGIAFQNSGNAHGSSIFHRAQSDGVLGEALTIASVGNTSSPSSLGATATFKNGGDVRLHNYGTGSFETGNETYVLAVEADGDIIEIDPDDLGGSGDNIYTADGTLEANRTVTMDGHNLTFDGAGDVVILDSGKMGVGTNSPQAQLDVVYNRDPGFSPQTDDGLNKYLSSIVGINGNNSSWSRTITGLTPNVPDGSVSGLFTFGQGDAARQAGHMYFVDTGADGEEYIGFAIRSGAWNTLGITGGGDVGVGTIAPAYKFQVFEGNNTSASISTNSESGDATLYLGTPFSGTSGAQKTAIIAEGQTTWSRAKLHFALEGSTGDNSTAANADISDAKMTIEYNGEVGIGTTTPDALLDVEGGGVRFSDYGTGGTYLDVATETVPAEIDYVLGVDSDGDVMEMNTAKSSKIFYPPAIAIDASAEGTNFTKDLHDIYETLYGTPAVSSSGAPTAIPTYDETELFYYVTDYDTGVFENVSINAAGVMTYDVRAVPSDNCSVMNIVFVVK